VAGEENLLEVLARAGVSGEAGRIQIARAANLRVHNFSVETVTLAATVLVRDGDWVLIDVPNPSQVLPQYSPEPVYFPDYLLQPWRYRFLVQ
jgi:hypothetical protein